MQKRTGYVLAATVLVLSLVLGMLYAHGTIPITPAVGLTAIATLDKDTSARDKGLAATQSWDVFSLEREANEVVWIPEQSAFYTHGGDKGRGDRYTESDSGIYRYSPGSAPSKVADLPSPIHHTGFAYSPDTGLAYAYAGGENLASFGKQIYWFSPRSNTTGICSELFPYSAVSVVAEYSTKQKKTYLFGGFNSSYVYHEVWVHDPAAKTITKSGTMLPPTAFAFQAAVYIETEDAVYLFGGIDKVGVSRTEIYRFDCLTEKITLLGVSCPDNRTKGMGAYHDTLLNAVVLAGGRDGGPWTGYTSRMWMLYLDDYSARILQCTLPGFCDDLDGGYDTVNNVGYFMRVTPFGYAGFSAKEPQCFGDSQKYICEVRHRE